MSQPQNGNRPQAQHLDRRRPCGRGCRAFRPLCARNPARRGEPLRHRSPRPAVSVGLAGEAHRCPLGRPVHFAIAPERGRGPADQGPGLPGARGQPERDAGLRGQRVGLRRAGVEPGGLPGDRGESGGLLGAGVAARGLPGDRGESLGLLGVRGQSGRLCRRRGQSGRRAGVASGGFRGDVRQRRRVQGAVGQLGRDVGALGE